LFYNLAPELRDLVNFWTASYHLPPRHEMLSAELLSVKDVKAVYPIARACFNTICVPVIHTDYEVFKKNMDTALKYGSTGFSEI
jgi:hypothetical protein